MIFKNIQTKKTLKDELFFSELTLDHTRKSLKNTESALDATTASNEFVKNRIAKIINSLFAMCSAEGLSVPPEVENILAELTLKNVVELEETVDGVVCNPIEANQ